MKHAQHDEGAEHAMDQCKSSSEVMTEKVWNASRSLASDRQLCF